jgi:SWI/SNF-related matrix-associated actin-dependent regulator of chromatin subfamily A member 5
LERAAQKLRLDQLVIQQGRMTQQQKGASKEELLTMIQHGAESIFKDTDAYEHILFFFKLISHTFQKHSLTFISYISSTVLDDDIEEILRLGEEKTAELNKKYENVTIDDLKNFTSDSAYQWNGEDWSSKVS